MSGGLAPTVLFIISVIHPVLNGGKVVKICDTARISTARLGAGIFTK